ncbi:MAG: prepilin-type N-terminal cleavage/methylation domain-containing protein [Planctomycetes bacterium]|nr:prepilin-type N-terminal cleavage/methylation domain-containing protein [Planctomycetota bacterium]MCB9918498.1 prepilin-type N-terminal cleavage/methylation domain-containing protein [Planctomycetota bacterium]
MCAEQVTHRRARCAIQHASPVTHGAPCDAGFTLVEILAAMLILAFGVTTVLGVMSSGLATEHNSELIRDAARLATVVREELEHGSLMPQDGQAPVPIVGGRVAEFPDMQYDLAFDPVERESTQEIACTVTVRWLRGGSDVSETFRFPLPRSRALYLRIRDEIERSRQR